MLSHFTRVQLLATPQTVALQAPLFIGFSRQEYWSGLPSPPPGDLPDPGMEPASLTSPELACGFLTTVREPHFYISKLSEGALLKPLNNQNQYLFSKEISKAIDETIASWPLGLS